MKNLKKLGKVLSSKEQKNVKGGNIVIGDTLIMFPENGKKQCFSDSDCPKNFVCERNTCFDPSRPYIALI